MKCMLQMCLALSNSKSFLGKRLEELVLVFLVCATTKHSALLVLQTFYVGLNPRFWGL